MTEGMWSVTPAEGGAESRPVPGKRGCSAMRCALAGLRFTSLHHSFTKYGWGVCYVLGDKKANKNPRPPPGSRHPRGCRPTLSKQRA